MVLGFMSLAASAQASSLDTLKIKTSAVCEMCKYAIEKDMEFEKGIKTAELDVATKMLLITYNPKKTNADILRKAVTKVGYDADGLLANPKAYEDLPECCKKGAHSEDEH